MVPQRDEIFEIHRTSKVAKGLAIRNMGEAGVEARLIQFRGVSSGATADAPLGVIEWRSGKNMGNHGWALGALVCLFLLQGCGRHQAVELEFQNEGRAQALLISEVAASQEPHKLVKCPLAIRNPTKEDFQVTLLKTGCSCYGVLVNGTPLEKGKPFTVKPGEAYQFDISALAARAQTEKEYRASFQIESAREKPRQVSATCVVNVYQDIRLAPMVVSSSWEPGNQSKELRKLVVEHVYRSEQPTREPPKFDRLPAFVSVNQPTLLGEPEQLDTGLWRNSWEVELTLQLDEAVNNFRSPQTFDVSFSGSNPDQQTTAQGQLLVEKSQPLLYATRLHFGTFAVGQKQQRRMLVTSRNQSDFTLHVRDGDLPEGVSVSLSEEPETRQWLTFSMEFEEERDFEESVRIQTSRPDQPELEILLQGRTQVVKPR
ncbi:MAG: hypothetical protein KDA80_06670 [Planctomycetaceae bacterium]|nr:hypothetical protein [Planctomycetaceae bacterium]